jgi:hypothetical protein
MLILSSVADAFVIQYLDKIRTHNTLCWESQTEHADPENVDVVSLSLLNLLRPQADVRVDQMSSTDLAYIGDAVYELLVRSRTVWPSKRTSDLQTKVVGLVRGE